MQLQIYILHLLACSKEIFFFSHLAATDTLAGTRQLTTENLFGSLSYDTEPAALLNGSWSKPWWTKDVCRLDRPGIDDGSLGKSTPRRRVVSWPLYRCIW
jgi:hypothetical protein